MKALPFFCALCLLAFSCKSRKNAAYPSDHSPFAQLETGACFGYCPMYKLTAHNDGWVDYDGQRFVEKTGRDSFRLSDSELARLREKVKKTNLPQYPDNIETQVVDAPYATLTVFLDGGKTKQVRGTVDRPAPLLELEALFKDLAEAHGLKVKQGIPPKAEEAPAATQLVQLEVGGCRGFCPIYRLTYNRNGDLEYEGKRFVEKIGTFNVKLTGAELARLKEQVSKTDIWHYPDEIPTTVADLPPLTITVWEGEKTKSVRGSAGFPKPLVALANLMKDLAEAHEIKVKNGVNPNDSPSATKGEILIALKPETNAGNWARGFADVGLTLVRRPGAENIWLATYDRARIEQKDLFARIRKSEGAVDVQVNPQAKERD